MYGAIERSSAPTHETTAFPLHCRQTGRPWYRRAAIARPPPQPNRRDRKSHPGQRRERQDRRHETGRAVEWTSSPVVAVAKVCDQGGHRQHQEASRTCDVVVAHPNVRTQGTTEVKDEADRRGRAEHRHGNADQQS